MIQKSSTMPDTTISDYGFCGAQTFWVNVYAFSSAPSGIIYGSQRKTERSAEEASIGCALYRIKVTMKGSCT